MAGCMEEYKETGKTSGRREVKINQSIIETNMKHTHTHTFVWVLQLVGRYE